jgi:hypothetical protein
MVAEYMADSPLRPKGKWNQGTRKFYDLKGAHPIHILRAVRSRGFGETDASVATARLSSLRR